MKRVIRQLLPGKLFVICLLLLGWACSKHSNPGAATGAVYAITGTLYFNSYYSGMSDSLPLSNKMVYIGIDTGVNKDDTSNHFYSVQSGTNGAFNFYITDTLLRYRLFSIGYDTSSKSFFPLYYGSIITDSPYNQLENYAFAVSVDTTGRNGLNILTVDTSGHVLPSVSVILYTSGVVAKKDSSYTGNGDFRTVTTDSLGKAFIAQLPAGQLFVNAMLKINNTDTLKLFNLPISIPITGILSDTLELK
jgi:hypothetical protein